MKKLLFALAWLASLVIVGAWASNSAMKHQLATFGAGLEESQAMLGFNHLLQYREIESDLSKGCSTAALERTHMAINSEMGLLATFHNKNQNSSLNKYIADRDPDLLGQLKKFKSKYDNSWIEPECT